MEPRLDEAPCGYISFSDDGIVTTINTTLSVLLGYEKSELIGARFEQLLPLSGQAFYQMYVLPMLKVESSIKELYLSLLTKDGRKIPILLNATRQTQAEGNENVCVLILVENRDKFENEIITARKEAEIALQEKKEALQRVEQLLAENMKYQKQIQNELSLAKNIQKLATMESSHSAKFNIESYYAASNELSGDIFGYDPITENKYGIILLDVMGHGISSALVTMSLRSLFQSLITKGHSPLEIVQELDSYLHVLFGDSHELLHYSTLIYIELDVSQRKITYLNAGHPSGIIQNQDGSQTLLSSTSPPIGMIEGTIFHQDICTYEKGSRLFLYTDGVTDLIHVNELNEVLSATLSLPIQDTKSILVNMLKETNRTSLEVDDQCFLLIDLP